MIRLRPLVLLLFIGSLLVLRVSAQSLGNQPVVVLPPDRDSQSLEGNMAFLEDSSRNRTIDDVIRLGNTPAFQPITSPVPNFGIITGLKTATPHWLRFRLKNSDARPQSWLAEIDFWCFDELQLFVVDAQNRVLSTSPTIGWKTPAPQRIKNNRHFWFPFTAPVGQVITVYLRVVKHRGTQIVPVELVRASAYESVVQESYLFWGGVLFTLLFMAVMSLIFFLTTLDHIYSRYVFCLLGLVGFFVINDGFLNQFGFAAQFWMPRQNVYFLFPLVLFYSQLTFVRRFLSLWRTPSHHWHAIGTGVLWSGFLCLVALTAEWFTPLTPTMELVLIRLFAALYWLPLPVIIAYIIVSIRRRYHVQEAWLYLVGILPFYTLNLGLVFANFGLLPTYRPVSCFAYYAPAALFEVLALMVGLAYRYKIDRDKTERLIKEHTVNQQRMYEADVQTLALQNSLLVEKERIARDLHDNVGAHLAFVVTNLTHISAQAEKKPITDGQRLASQLRTIVTHTREAVKLLRETIWAIHQESFTVEEFAERLNQYINRYVHETDGLHVDVQVSGSQSYKLSSSQVLNLFRIVQEALNNVIKHAQATQAIVQLFVEDDGHINLRIHDNGQGFSWTDEALAPHHYGLRNMETRAQELGGTFRIFEEEGTTVEVAV
ncbi:sensor histidine kinase [Spirosoma fluviale]|uniref:Signal transduction histidine kinase n=1 Tax=Spirosoma fluviale TaxID=1597977 RepID=A0A286G0J8_9BACT|nr:7TM-DISM domain-containing protein [Spirosoma fluviale]SOD88689.1 Signal transduction histidine kinase [Spirosoma fluviale]